MAESVQSVSKKLSWLLDKKRKLILGIIAAMAVVHSLVETAGVSIVMPFISVASNPELVKSGRFRVLYEFFNVSDVTKFVIHLGIALILFYFFRTIFSVVYSYFMHKFSLGTYRYFSARLFKTYLAIPFKVYVQKNPSVFNQMINGESNHLSQFLLNFVQIFTEAFTVLLLYIFMILVNWQITAALTVILIVIIIVVFFTLIRTSKKLGEKRYASNVKLSKTIFQTFNNFKFIKLKGNEKEVFKTFNDSTSTLSRLSIMSTTLGTIPKSVLENLGFSLLIGAVCYILWRYDSASMVIPVISMYALALYRMLPAINRILGYFNTIAYLERSLHRIYDDLHLETTNEDFAPCAFSKSIRGENLIFSYLKGGEVIKDISFEIIKGEKVAITGESGSGKTTLVDIIIGIHRPLKGGLYIDDVLIDNSNIRSWRRKIGYIPQSIYLFDGTVAENVIFGSEPDENKIIESLKKAKIWDFLETQQGIHTRVGEGGIQLSGGQKQRIGIARALYNDPEILVLDEATSSLDDATEAQIMEEIYDISGSKTLIIIAHRLSTIERCDRCIRIEEGEIAA